MAAAILAISAFSAPGPAYAAPHGGGGGGGGFHGGGGGGGFHGGGGGFPGGGGVFHGGSGGFRGGFPMGMHHDFDHHDFDGRHDGFHHRFIPGLALGLGLGYLPFAGDYGDYGYSQPYAAQDYYYCNNPAGYYPTVSQCYGAWQVVPAG